MSFLSRGRWKFRSVGLKEGTEYLGNPSCGWFRMFPFHLDEKTDFAELYWCLQEKETLVQVVVLLDAYRQQQLPADALERLEKICQFFRNYGKEMILRFAYDGNGQGLRAEPERMQQILDHMQQIGPIVQPFAGDIFVAQGLFIGSWGEMHDSHYMSREKLQLLAETWREAIGEKIPIAVRTPLLWRKLHKYNTEPGSTNICLFNDGMFGSGTDLGTYGVQKREAADWWDSWCREDELDFMKVMNHTLPYGGEAVGTAPEGKLLAAVAEMKRTGLSYLNATHDGKCLSRWRQETWKEKGSVWNGISGYDYIGAHMGCRPLIRKASGRYDKGMHVEITMENTGFAHLLEEAEVVVTAQADGREAKEQVFPLQPEDLMPGIPYHCLCQFPDGQESGAYNIYVQLRRKRDRRILRFANDGQEKNRDKVCIGLFSNL